MSQERRSEVSYTLKVWFSDSPDRVYSKTQKYNGKAPSVFTMLRRLDADKFKRFLGGLVC